MATVELKIGGRQHELACRDGEEAHLRLIAGLVDIKARDADRMMGGMSEARQMLFAALMLADELNDARLTAERLALVTPPPPAPDPAVAERIAHLAERLERLSALLPDAMDGVEQPAANP